MIPNTNDKKGNLALIDFSNIYKVFKGFSWCLSFKKYRKWLKEQFDVSEAIIFLGTREGNERLGEALKQAGFTVYYLPVTNNASHVKGGIDVNLVVHGMMQYPKYDKVVLCSGDGDFLPLVQHLLNQDRLKAIICASFDALSGQLFFAKKSAVVSMEHLSSVLSKQPNSSNSRKAS